MVFMSVIVLLVSYLLGAIPFGLIIVRLKTGKDIRTIESGRTGGTNVSRAAGFWAGALTAVLDFLKSMVSVLLVRFLAGNQLLPHSPWLEVLAPALAVIGHNYSIFLVKRNESGKLKFGGGAGGAPTAGGAMGLWIPSILFILPIAMIILFGVGYASLATISVALSATILFAIRAWSGANPWEYIFYGISTGLILIWALMPNLKRLSQGTERLVGLRAKHRRTQSPKNAANH